MTSGSKKVKRLSRHYPPDGIDVLAPASSGPPKNIEPLNFKAKDVKWFRIPDKFGSKTFCILCEIIPARRRKSGGRDDYTVSLSSS